MTYRGPNAQRINAQFSGIQGYAGEAVCWRQYVSGASGNVTAYLAGGGITHYYREQWITGLLAAPQMGEARFRETMLPGGQVIAGDMVLSTQMPLRSNDEVIWRGVTYRIEGDTTPIHIGGQLWYRTVVRRGDATG